MTPTGDVAPPMSARYCPSCGRALEESDSFCPFCGRSLGMWPVAQYGQVAEYRPPSFMESARRGVRAVTLLALGALFILLLINVIILIWSPAIVLPETADPAHGNTLFLIIPWADPLVPLFEVSGWSFALYHIFLVFAIGFSFVWMVLRSYGTFRKELTLNKPEEGHSPFWIVGTVFFAVLAFNSIYAIALMLMGVEITTPDFPSKELWQLLNGFASASVWEELITRVLYIGVPLLLIDLAMHKRKGLWRYFLGGGFDFGGKELALIWASSGIFALGHIVYWDTWKIVPTWMAGIAFGYLFLRLGLYACIMLHFTVDYLTIPLDLSGNAALVALLLGLLILFWDFLGSVYLVAYVNRIIRFLTGADLKSNAKKVPIPGQAASSMSEGKDGSPAPGPAPYGSPPAPPPKSPSPYGRTQGQGFYSCTKCGNTQARYSDGKLECTRCGHKE